jgi:hypothetical protein
MLNKAFSRLNTPVSKNRKKLEMAAIQNILQNTLLAMNMKHILKVISITLLCSLITFSPCYAARIYNETNVPIDVQGEILGTVDNYTRVNNLPAGQRSDSLNWKAVTEVFVEPTANHSNTLCQLEFGAHNQIVGGNYMIVRGQVPSNAQCVVCDSNHKVIVGSGSC